MTTATKNTLTLAELLGERSMSEADKWMHLLAHQGEPKTESGRTYADINFITDGTTMTHFVFPSCYKVRETVEWETAFGIFTRGMVAATSEGGVTLDEAFEGFTTKFLEDVIEVAETAASLHAAISQHLVRLSLGFWAIADAYQMLKTGELIEEGSGRSMSVPPISEDIYGVGGRTFVSDLWDLIEAAQEYAGLGVTQVVMNSEEKTPSKPVSKASKKKAAQKASKKARRNARK